MLCIAQDFFLALAGFDLVVMSPMIQAISWFLCLVFFWGERGGAVVIPGRSVGKTNVQYRGLIFPNRPTASRNPSLNLFFTFENVIR